MKVSKRGIKNCVLLAAVIIVALVSLVITRRLAEISTSFARDYGYRATSVVKTDLAVTGPSKLLHGGRNWKDLPFHLDSEEELAVERCVEIAKRVRSQVNDMSRFLEEQARVDLEQLLAERPDFFYAQFLLGAWHRAHGHDEVAIRLTGEALSNAPTIIALQYVDPTGAPAADLPIQGFALECNRVQAGYLDPSLKLYYPALVSDTEGFVYLPVYDTVYRADDMAHPSGYDAAYPTLGWFRARSKIGVVPPVVVTRQKRELGVGSER